MIKQYHVVPFHKCWVRLKLDFGYGQAGLSMGQCMGWCMVCAWVDGGGNAWVHYLDLGMGEVWFGAGDGEGEGGFGVVSQFSGLMSAILQPSRAPQMNLETVSSQSCFINWKKSNCNFIRTMEKGFFALFNFVFCQQN